MSTEQLPLPSKEIYGGFWIRLGACLIDMTIVTPMTGLATYMDHLSKTTYWSLLGLHIILSYFICIYCVKRWGGSPGKLILRLKIVMENGEDVDWPAVLLRPSVSFAILFVFLIVRWLSMEQIPDDVFAASNHLERVKIFSAVFPKLYANLLLFGNLWLLESFALLANKKRRAIHDYMAGTVVIRRKDQARLQAGEDF